MTHCGDAEKNVCVRSATDIFTFYCEDLYLKVPRSLSLLKTWSQLLIILAQNKKPFFSQIKFKDGKDSPERVQNVSAVAMPHCGCLDALEITVSVE